MLVHRSRYEKAGALAADAATGCAPGDLLAPLVGARQRARVRDWVRRGIKEGARRSPADPRRPMACRGAPPYAPLALSGGDAPDGRGVDAWPRCRVWDQN
ncbi:hypothetical protein ACIQF5_35235 [Streptomyces goshikiensis]|uniref:hypothetical protein n=1 Tax=Streptomyces goshikiensis TaxID=1942 RepID=UPI0038194CD1